MSELKIAVSRSCPDCFSTHRECVNIDKSNYIDVAAIILSVNDVEHGKLDEIDATGYGIPVFIATENEERVPAEYLPRISGVFEHCESRKEFYGRQLETAASHYETQLRPPFFRALVDYVNQGNSAFGDVGATGTSSCFSSTGVCCSSCHGMSSSPWICGAGSAPSLSIMLLMARKLAVAAPAMTSVNAR